MPLNQVPLNQVPLNQVPLNQVNIAQSPLNQVPLNQVPLNQVGIFVDCTKIDCTASSSATIGDAAAAGALRPGQTYPDLVQALPLNQVTISRSPLNQVPLNQVPLNQVGLFVDCSKVDCATATFGAAAHAGAIRPGKTYGELLEALPLNQVPLLQVPLNQVPLNQVPLNQVNIVRSPLNQVPLNQVPLNQVGKLVDCSKVDCATGTLGDAVPAGAIKDDATLADLVPYLPADFTLGQMMLALIDPDTFPWEQLPFVPMNVQSIGSGGTLPFTLTFSLTGPAATEPADVRVTMPPGALYKPGTAMLGPAGGPSDALDDPVVDGSQLRWSLPSVHTGLRYALRFALLPGLTVGSTEATATVNAVAAAPAAVTIRGANAGHYTPADALDLQPGRVYFGYVRRPGECTTTAFRAQPAGSRVIVRLANQTSDSALSGDDDLVVYGEAGIRAVESQLRAAGLIADRAVCRRGRLLGRGAGRRRERADQGRRRAREVGERRRRSRERVAHSAGRSGGSYLIQVTGYNRQTSDLPFTLRVEVDPPPTSAPAPVARTFPFAGEGSAGTLPADYDKYLNTLFLVDAKRIGDTYGAADETRGDERARTHSRAGPTWA